MALFPCGSANGGGGGTSDYSQLSNKPSINNVTLVGNKTSDDLGLEGAYTTITYAQWQAMTDAQRESGKYYVTDVPGYGSQSGENVFGVFIDTDRIIVATTTFRTDTSYTATEDCAVVVGVPTSANAESAIKINNVKVGAIYSQSGITAAYDTFLVKKGQTITIEPSYTQGDSSYTVYGLTYGTKNVFPAIHYSTDEQVVGTWVDGKTLYQKTIVTNAQVALSDNSWTAVPFASGDVPSDADTMFCTEWFNPSDSHLICDNRTRFIYDNGAIKGATSQTGGQTVPAGLTLTIRYTKASS